MRPRYFWDTPNRVNAHPTDVVSESGPAFEHRVLRSAPEAQDIVQDVWLRWRSTDRSAVLDPRQPEVERFRCQVDGKHKKNGQICWRDKPSVSDLESSSLADFFAFICARAPSTQIPV